jgi:hypothetical protein
MSHRPVGNESCIAVARAADRLHRRAMIGPVPTLHTSIPPLQLTDDHLDAEDRNPDAQRIPGDRVVLQRFPQRFPCAME